MPDLPEPGGVDVGGALTRKLGPLPAWGWGVAIGGGLLAVKFLRGSSSGTPRETLVVPTGAPSDSGDPFLSDLGNRVDYLGDRIDFLSGIVNNNQSTGNVPGNSAGDPSTHRTARPGAYVAKFLDLVRAKYGVEAYRRLLRRFDRPGENLRETRARLVEGPYSKTEGRELLQFVLRRGGFSAARNFAEARKRSGETTAQAFLRIFATPISQARPPTTSG